MIRKKDLGMAGKRPQWNCGSQSCPIWCNPRALRMQLEVSNCNLAEQVEASELIAARRNSSMLRAEVEEMAEGTGGFKGHPLDSTVQGTMIWLGTAENGAVRWVNMMDM